MSMALSTQGTRPVPRRWSRATCGRAPVWQAISACLNGLASPILARSEQAERVSDFHTDALPDRRVFATGFVFQSWRRRSESARSHDVDPYLAFGPYFARPSPSPA